MGVAVNQAGDEYQRTVIEALAGATALNRLNRIAANLDAIAPIGRQLWAIEHNTILKLHRIKPPILESQTCLSKRQRLSQFWLHQHSVQR